MSRAIHRMLKIVTKNNAIREQTKEKVDRQRNGVTKEKFIRIITDR